MEIMKGGPAKLEWPSYWPGLGAMYKGRQFFLISVVYYVIFLRKTIKNCFKKNE